LPVNLFKNEIKAGDIAFIWVANDRKKGIERGIYAKARVTAPPEDNRQPYERETSYWIDEDEKRHHSRQPRLELQYVNVPLCKPLVASALQGVPALANLLVLRMPQRSVYKLSQVEGITIASLVDESN